MGQKTAGWWLQAFLKLNVYGIPENASFILDIPIFKKSWGSKGFQVPDGTGATGG